VSGPGFIFWGLFPVLGLLVGAYLLWMMAVERRGRRRERDGEPR
jgi:hypothetical protein